MQMRQCQMIKCIVCLSAVSGLSGKTNRCADCAHETCIRFKPFKWAIKILTLSEAKTGYVLITCGQIWQHFLLHGNSFFTRNYYTSAELITLTCRTVDWSHKTKCVDLKKMKYFKSQKCKEEGVVSIVWKVTCIMNILWNLSGSLIEVVVIRHEKKGDTPTFITVDIMNACGVCKQSMCAVPGFLQCYAMAWC